MRFLNVKLTGYIGIYNGLGLSELELDFTKCKNPIIVISGPNGVGKSTILNALTIIPDNNGCFVPSMVGKKDMILTDNENIYEIHIIHPLDKNNNRGTTKAMISKNGEELNPNGNISSYKDIIFAEFDMDANYVELSKVSGDNRGLADKRPAERKKIMSSLISSLEVYNNMYKILNKKANIFKSYITNLSSKIKSVGDESVLRSTLSSIIVKEQRIKDEIEKSKEMIIEANTYIHMKDPDGQMQKKYDAIVQEVSNLSESLKKIRFELYNTNKDIDYDNLNKLIIQLESEVSTSTLKVQELSIESKNLISQISSFDEDKSNLTIKIDKLKEDYREDIEEVIHQYRNEISRISNDFIKLGITDMNKISKDEIDHTINTIELIIEMIDYLYSIMTPHYHDIVRNIYDLDFKKMNIDNRTMIDSLKDSLSSAISEKAVIDNDIKTLNVLKKRPKECKVDHCIFISNALDIEKKYTKGINYSLKEVEAKIISIKNTISEYEIKIDEYENMDNIRTKLHSIIDLINSNKALLSKFSITTRILNLDTFLNCLKNRYEFSELRSLSNYMDISNELIIYHNTSESLQSIESEYMIYNNNRKLIEEFKKEIEIIDNKRQSIIDQYNYNEKYLKTETDLLNSKQNTLNRYKALLERYNEYLQMNDYRDQLEKETEDMNKSFNTSLEYLKKITDLKEYINNLNTELNPLLNEKRSIESKITMLDSYNMEYAMYNEKYEYVDKLRKYSSPTAGGIQSLFMSIYMDKTLNMVNELLGMMFNGEYRICRYIINEEEFRIPFIGNGLTVDDISSGSTSQVCIMGMIISLVLAYISSGKYNIRSLDEIDGGLDHINRYMFVDVLNKITQILQIDQLFIISHSVESALNNVDVILLSEDDVYTDQFANANIIYMFKCN